MHIPPITRSAVFLLLATFALPCALRADEAAAKTETKADSQTERTSETNSSSSSRMPDRTGFLDVAEVFKQYKKFKNAKQDIQDEVASLSLKAKRMVDEIRQLEAATKSADENSSQRRELERELIQKRRKVEDFQRVQRENLVKQEATLYKTVYLEVLDAVRVVADEQRFTAVMRFDRSAANEVSSREEILKFLNRGVVFHRDENDLTDAIIDRLNTKYVAQSESKSSKQ